MSTDITCKICTLSREELEKTVEDLWSRVGVIQRLTYLLMADLEDGLRESRAREVSGTMVTLSFQKRGIDVTQWLSSEAWTKAVDLLEVLDDLYSDVDVPARKDAAEQPKRMTGEART